MLFFFRVIGNLSLLCLSGGWFLDPQETVEQFSTEYEEDAHTEEAMRALFLQEISNFHPEIIPFLADRLYW